MGTARLSFLLLFGSLLLGGCTPPDQTISIPFRTQYGGQPIACDTGDGVALTDFRIYVHNIRLRSSSGTHIDAKLAADSRWQSNEIALLDLEDGTGYCANGSAGTNNEVNVRVPPGEYEGMSFSVGVPAILNHADPLLAQSPLNLTAMHWHWRSGYKFLRAGIRHNDLDFWLHLGSSRCRGTIGNIEGCESANRVVVDLAEFRPGADAVVFDFARLFDFVSGTGEPVASCSSGPGEDACNVPFQALGLDVASGEQLREPIVFAHESIQ